jgi:hypothetical protein
MLCNDNLAKDRGPPPNSLSRGRYYLPHQAYPNFIKPIRGLVLEYEKSLNRGRPVASEVRFISVLSQFSLDSAEGGQRIEIAKYKKIENSNFLSDRHPFNIPSLLVGTVGLTLRLNFEGWLNSQGFRFSTPDGRAN